MKNRLRLKVPDIAYGIKTPIPIDLERFSLVETMPDVGEALSETVNGNIKRDRDRVVSAEIGTNKGPIALQRCHECRRGQFRGGHGIRLDGGGCYA